MNTAFAGLLFGLLGAIALIYLLIVVNFQSWSDPFVIVTALPCRGSRNRLDAVCHRYHAIGCQRSPAPSCAWVLQRPTVLLVISFARERLDAHGDALAAALEAGFVRFRPVCMTALAMVIGMIPMALGLGEGGEQNAPLGRAVIGGLAFATVATLIFVPVVFSIVHRKFRRGPLGLSPPAGSPRGQPAPG